jgi:Zn finger protein HypA/HybF involved in hydrogenase expression
MFGHIWRNVRCQRCGALPIDNGKPTVNCPKCHGSAFGEKAPDYQVLTEADRRFLQSIRIAA